MTTTHTRATVTSPPSTHPWGRAIRHEAGGYAIAAVLALVVTAQLATTQAWMMFADGDSLITVLLTKSLVSGRAQDWAMSPVLFIPETAVYAALSALGLGVRATLTLNAWVNFLALYAAIRVVSGSRRHVSSPVRGALLAFSVFCLFAVLNGGEGRDGFHLASAFALTTYYSATVIGVILVVGITRRVLDHVPSSPRVPALALVGIVLISALSTLTNPLFAAWGTVPLILALLLLRATAIATWRPVLVLALATVAGTALGMLARMPLSAWIVADARLYVRAGQWAESFVRYAGLAVQSAANPLGAGFLLLTAAMWGVSCALAVRFLRRGMTAPAFVTGSAVLVPVVVVIGMVALGTDGIRYLQPVAFMPPLALVTIPALRRRRERARSSENRWWQAGAAGMAAVVALGWSLPRAVSEARTTDVDLACVVQWVDSAGRVGAGQFWTVRAPQAYAKDPASLIQVDHQFTVYEWLTNRADSASPDVTFVVTDAMSAPFQYPDGVSESDASTVTCGRYTIHDFGDLRIPIAHR